MEANEINITAEGKECMDNDIETLKSYVKELDLKLLILEVCLLDILEKQLGLTSYYDRMM